MTLQGAHAAELVSSVGEGGRIHRRLSLRRFGDERSAVLVAAHDECGGSFRIGWVLQQSGELADALREPGGVHCQLSEDEKTAERVGIVALQRVLHEDERRAGAGIPLTARRYAR